MFTTTEPVSIHAPPRLDLARLSAWERARQLWLDSRPSPNTRRAYERACLDFFDFAACHPWEVTPAHLAAWTADLRRRRLAPETVNQRLTALSSFYTFASRSCTRPDGSPLHPHNPVQALPRPRRNPYGKSRYLTLEETRAFLAAIPRHTLQGSRDYALFLAYLATGRRNTEIRRLRWGDLDHHGNRTVYQWQGKGTRRKDELPERVWSAIREFLAASAKLDSIQPEDYLFTPLNRNASRLPNVSGHRRLSDRPLSACMVGRLLKKYCRRAGLDSSKVTVHTLRHTAAMLRKQAGDDLEQISAFLAHSNLAVTQIYLHRLEGQTDTSWAKVEALLCL